MKNVVITISIFLVLSFSQLAGAAQLKTWVNQFLTSNSQVLALDSAILSAEQKYKSKIASAFPDVNVQASHLKQKTLSFDPSPDNIYSAHLVVTQPIYLGGRVWRGIQLEKSTSKLARFNSKDQKESLLKNFLELCFEWSVAQKRLDVLKTSIQYQKQFVEITAKKRNKGNARDFEYHQNVANLMSYQTRLLQLEAQVRKVENSIMAFLEIQEGSLDSLEPIVLSHGFIQNKEQLLKNAIEKSPGILVAKEKVHQAELNKSFELGSHLPSLTLEGSVGYTGLKQSDLFDETFRTEKVGVNLIIPIFSGLSSLYQRRSNNYQIVQAEKGLKARLIGVKSDIDTAYEVYLANEKVFKMAKQWDLSASKAFNSGKKNFNVGAIGNSQMLQLQIGREQAKMSYLDALKSYNMAIVQLAYVSGYDIVSAIQ